MPYIKEADKRRALVEPETAGELNFAITTIMAEYLERKGLGYAHINDCMGACEGAKLEFYRRVAVPYEDTKIVANGDVYPTAILTS